MAVAVPALLDSGFTDAFPRADKQYADPMYNNQTYCLHSFVPSKGALPDKEGVFGFMKCRGAFQTVDEAHNRAEWLIRNVDSYHDIQTGYAGRPFPVCRDTRKYVSETKDIDIRKKATQTVSEDLKEKRAEEKREVEDIKHREEKLLSQSKEDYEEPPLESYTTMHVKKANLVYTYLETRKKMMNMRGLIQKVYGEISAMDAESSTYRTQYYDNYMAARRSAGIKDEEVLDNFMQFIMEDADLDFDIHGTDEMVHLDEEKKEEVATVAH